MTLKTLRSISFYLETCQFKSDNTTPVSRKALLLSFKVFSITIYKYLIDYIHFKRGQFDKLRPLIQRLPD